VLWGAGQFVPALEAWITEASVSTATIGGFFYVALASIGAGMTVSCVRWFVVDTLHHVSGIRPPKWDFAKLSERTAAFDLLINIHYKYYQFYANSLVALLFAYGAWRSQHSLNSQPIGLADFACLGFAFLFWFASRDTMRRYYERAGALLREEKVLPLILQ
jgi:hypothetical protein